MNALAAFVGLVIFGFGIALGYYLGTQKDSPEGNG